MNDKYKPSYFTFHDEGLAPKMMGTLSDKLIESKMAISWLADSRFEPFFFDAVGKKISLAGCKMLYFGLESANDLYIAYYRKKTAQRSMKKSDIHPILNEGIFIGTFNFNLAQIIQSGLSGKTAETIREEKVNVLFDIDNNRIFTISELAKDIISKSNGESNISEIIDLIKEK